MKIGFDAKRIFFNQTGLGNHNRRFVEAFLDPKAEANAAVEVVLFSPKKAERSPFWPPFQPFFEQEKAQIVEPSGLFRLFGGSIWRSFFLTRAIEKAQLSAFVGLSSELPVGLSRLPKLRKIVVVHDLIFLRLPGFYPFFDRFFFERKTRSACRIADQIVAVSEQTRADLIEFLNVEPSKITVVPPAIDPIFYEKPVPNSFSESPAEKAEKGRPDGCPARPFLLSVGSITERKNLLLTVRAFEKIAAEKAVDLVVIGRSDSKNAAFLAKIRAFLAEKGLTDRVHFFENVATEDLPGWFAAAAIFVYPSIFEGFGMPIAEALFSKTPVVATDAKWAHEAAGDGAEFIDPTDADGLAAAFRRLLGDEKWAAELAEKGWQHVQKFRAERVAEQVRQLLFD